MLKRARQIIEDATSELPAILDFKKAIEASDEETSESIENTALDFIENEVGRYDWLVNWEVYKSKHDVASKVQEYLNYYAIIDVTPEDVITFIDKLKQERPGHWD